MAFYLSKQKFITRSAITSYDFRHVQVDEAINTTEFLTSHVSEKIRKALMH